MVLLAEGATSAELVGLFLVQEGVRSERPARDPLELAYRAIERSLWKRRRLEAVANERTGRAELDEQNLDRLAIFLEVDCGIAEFAVVLEPPRGQGLVDPVSVSAPSDEVDVGVGCSHLSEQEVERPAAAQPNAIPAPPSASAISATRRNWPAGRATHLDVETTASSALCRHIEPTYWSGPAFVSAPMGDADPLDATQLRAS